MHDRFEIYYNVLIVLICFIVYSLVYACTTKYKINECSISAETETISEHFFEDHYSNCLAALM